VEEARRQREWLYQAVAQALVIDLDRAVRWHPLRPWQRRRITRWVLLFEEVGDKDSRQQPLVREMRAAGRRHGCTSALIVAAGASTLADRLRDTTVNSFGAAAAELDGR
jgi:hypothetical protein